MTSRASGKRSVTKGKGTPAGGRSASNKRGAKRGLTQVDEDADEDDQEQQQIQQDPQANDDHAASPQRQNEEEVSALDF